MRIITKGKKLFGCEEQNYRILSLSWKRESLYMLCFYAAAATGRLLLKNVHRLFLASKVLTSATVCRRLALSSAVAGLVSVMLPQPLFELIVPTLESLMSFETVDFHDISLVNCGNLSPIGKAAIILAGGVEAAELGAVEPPDLADDAYDTGFDAAGELEAEPVDTTGGSGEGEADVGKPSASWFMGCGALNRWVRDCEE